MFSKLVRAVNATGRLCCTHAQEEAVAVMDEFGWGAEFLRVNADVLETYAACADGAEVVRAQVRQGRLGKESE